MALSPQHIRETEFKQARRGYEPVEVDAFRAEVADALEAAQNEATAMEARARAAVARLQELSQGPPTEAVPTPAPAAEGTRGRVEESETISRTLLLAQRTADQAVADAQAEADRVLAAAREDATGQLDGAKAEAAELIEAAKHDATREGETERVRVEGEVHELVARRDFLESDVEHLEQFIMAQRERIVEATSELQALCQRVPSGLADMRRPLLSAAASESNSSGGDGDRAADSETSEISEITRVAEAEQANAAAAGDVGDVDDVDDGLPPPDRDPADKGWSERR